MVGDSDEVKAGAKLATWGITMPIVSEYAGQVKFDNIEEGVNVAQQTDEVTGLSTLVVITPKRATRANIRPQIKMLDDKGV
ncbi:DNA-directed RNA polymerase subunit beta' [Oligella ureolytica]